jgi:hypothetical protein
LSFIKSFLNFEVEGPGDPKARKDTRARVLGEWGKVKAGGRKCGTTLTITMLVVIKRRGPVVKQ